MPKKKAVATLSLQAYERIRTKILTGECPVGSPLSRRRLAGELGMSLIPVSEALQRLETEDLVESKPRAGTRVKIPTTDDIRGRYLVREALESQSARLFAQTATREQKRELWRLAEEVDRLSVSIARTPPETKQRASYAFEQAHVRLHTHIAACSGFPALVQAIERSRVLVFNWLFNVAADLDALPERWHRDLAQALSKGDVREADEAMRKHVRYRLEAILERFERMNGNGRDRGRFARGPQPRRRKG